jgi:hypothetical protein
MHDPYKMVVVSLASSVLLAAYILFYKFIYPKKNISLFMLLILISLLPMVSLLRPGDYESGDFNIHIYRIMSFYDSLKEGLIMPSWAAELNATYGNPLFILNYSFPYYSVSLFHFIGFSFITSMKIYLGLAFFLSGIFMYLWVDVLTKNKLGAFTAAIFYLFSPYHLIDFHFRATLGESAIFTMAPLVLLFITLYFKTKKFYILPLITLSTMILILAHPLVSLPFLLIIFIFIIILGKRNKDLPSFIKVILSMSIGAIGSFYQWIPFFLYAPYTYQDPGNDVKFYYFPYLFYSPWRFGILFQGPKGELAHSIGYTQLLVVLVSIYMLFKNKINKELKPYFIFSLTIFIITLISMNPISKGVWNIAPILGMLTLFGRLALVLTFCTSLLAAFVVVSIKKIPRYHFIVGLLLTITIFYTILNWGHRRVIPEITDETLRAGVWKSTITEGATAGFLNNKWADINHFWFDQLPKQHLEIIKGKASVQVVKRSTLFHSYVINAETPITIKENTLFYPGWSLSSNSKTISIYPGTRGIIYAKLNKGLQYLELKYDDWFIYKISKYVALLIFFGTILIFLVSYTLRKSKLKFIISS